MVEVTYQTTTTGRKDRMASLYLGTLCEKNKEYEIHAFTKDLAFREFTKSEIADPALFQKLLYGRYNLLAHGRPIYCTAVNPDPENEIETNPHDAREGTIHIVALDKDNEIECAISVAIDLGQMENGSPIGVPLENKWRPLKYDNGVSLDSFRKKYIRLHYGKDRDVASWEMAELYRHYKKSKPGDIVPRLGVYAGLYHLCVREARKKGVTPTWLFVFDAVPRYFNLYKLAAGAVLRDMTINDHPRFISPHLNDLKLENLEGCEIISFEGQQVSRSIMIPVPRIDQGRVGFRLERMSFLDGLVDIFRFERNLRNHAILPPLRRIDGFTLDDRIKLRTSAAVTAVRIFLEDYIGKSFTANAINIISQRKLGVRKWIFNEIGSIQKKTNVTQRKNLRPLE